MTSVYAFICKPCVYVIAYLAAPRQPPGSIEWNLTNSKIFLNWEHVKAMENESEVTGYKVSLSEKKWKLQNWGNKYSLSSCHLNKWFSHCSGKIDLSTPKLHCELALAGLSKLKDLFQVIKWKVSSCRENSASSKQCNNQSHLIHITYFVE